MPLQFLAHRGCVWGEFATDFVHVAPSPSLPRHPRTHYWMLCLVEMLRRVFARRRIATADVATGHALAQCNPPGALLQAFFAGDRRAKGCKVGFGQILQMFTWLVHIFSLLFSDLDGFRLALHCSICCRVSAYAGLSRSPRGMMNRSKMEKSP